MKTIAVFLIIIFNGFANSGYLVVKSGTGGQGITIADAEKVLGEPAILLNNTLTEKQGIKQNNCAYVARAVDPVTNKTGSLYVMTEQYATAYAAHKAYADIVYANRNMAGQEKVNDLGDEGYFHTDGTAFYLFIFRKGREMARLKVNKITSKTSLPELRKLVVRMAEKSTMMPE